MASSIDGQTWGQLASGNSVLSNLCYVVAPRRVKSYAAQTTTLTENFTIIGGIGANVMAYTYDTKTWYPSISANTIFGPSNTCNAVTWNGSLWVAGGDGPLARIAYSSDGINWTASASAAALIELAINTVVWNGALWLAGGSNTDTIPTRNKIIHSYDGKHWYASESQRALLTYCSGLAWNGKIFVAVGGSSGGGAIIYSTNGIDWTGGISPFSGAGISIACSSTMWVAVGTGSGTNVVYSYDGFDWVSSASGSALITLQGYSVAYNGSMWVIASTGANPLIYSTDGETWTASDSGTALFPNGAATVGWNGSCWIAGGLGPNYLAYSYDGITWAQSSSASSLFSTVITGLGFRRIQPFTIQNQIVSESSAALTIAADPISIDCSTTNNYILTLTQNSSLTLFNAPTSGRVYRLTLFLIQDSGAPYLVTWPISVLWGTIGAPTLSTAPNTTDIIELITYNAGTSWFGIYKGGGF